MKKECSRIAIVAKYPFPNGMAATNRILAYGKGLVENGVEVTYFACLPPTKENLDYAPQSVFGGIKCLYSYNRTKGNNRFVSILRSCYSLVLSMNNLRKDHKKTPYDYLFISSDSIFFLSLFVTLAKILDIKTIFIGDEYPIPIRKKLKNKIPLWKKYLYKILHLGIDYRVLMTDALRDFYNIQISRKLHYMLPSIIDVSRFQDEGVCKDNRLYLCYMGNMDLSKDNVDNIVEAFFLVHKEYPTFELHLYGTPTPDVRKYLEKIIDSHNLQNSVLFKGRASYDEVPKILMNAYILVTSQPKTKRAEGGFPTKLGEYLISKRPTLLTDVGEISKYFKDGKNAYMVEPCNPELYAKKIIYIIEHYDEALKVAQKGKEYVIDNFGNKAVAYDLLSFLNKHL